MKKKLNIVEANMTQMSAQERVDYAMGLVVVARATAEARERAKERTGALPWERLEELLFDGWQG
jgi:hypothetical protein